MQIAPRSTVVDPSSFFGRPLGTLLRTYEDSLGRHRTRQSMLLVADPRGTLLEDTDLAGAIESAQWMARTPEMRSPTIAVLQAGEGAFLLTPAYHGPDMPVEIDPGPVRLLDLDAPGTTSPIVTSILGNTDAPYFRALVTAKQVVTPEFA